MKRGRPKKKKPSETTALSTEKTMETPILPPPPCKAARTRSGRLIKTPKILEKVEITTFNSVLVTVILSGL